MATKKRNWHDVHLEAGYHLQKWGPTPTNKDSSLGVYDCIHGGVQQTLEVKFMKEGPTGYPEIELVWEDGHRVTVIDEATAVEYLLRDNAVKRR